MSKKHSGKQTSASRQGQQTQSLPPYKPQQDKYATVAASVTTQRNPEQNSRNQNRKRATASIVPNSYIIGQGATTAAPAITGIPRENPEIKKQAEIKITNIKNNNLQIKTDADED